MIKFFYPDGSHCYRVLHSVHAVYRDEEDTLVARVTTPEGAFKVFEITGFEMLSAGGVYQ